MTCWAGAVLAPLEHVADTAMVAPAVLRLVNRVRSTRAVPGAQRRPSRSLPRDFSQPSAGTGLPPPPPTFTRAS